MAGRQYQMAFEIGAKLQGQFGSAFKGAQASVAQLQNQIQSLNKTQGDIAAYQKQQTAVAATKAKLESLQRQYALLQDSIGESGEASTQLKNQMLSKQLQIEKTSASLEQQTQKLDSMGAALTEAGVDTSNLAQASSSLEAQISGLKSEQEALAASTEEMGQATESAENAMKDMVETMTLLDVAEKAWSGIEKVIGAYADAIGTAANFESSMANVAALSGANASELEQLSTVAKELGASTSFTAQQSADAMGYMAMAGWDTQQIIAGMPGVLSLAAAAGEDLALVSDILTDSMTAFGLSADQSAHYADVLAATATNANTNVATMGETFKYVAPVAGALGYSVEDVSTAIGLMANAGVKGSNAGTALRNVFNGLIDGANLSAEAFGEVEVSAVRADGTMMDFGTTIEMLRGYFAQMTEAEQVANATAIAGQRGYSGLLAILNATDADFAKLTASINNCEGAAQRMADIKLNNFNGQVTLLQSAIEGVKITIGEQFTPVLTQVTSVAANIMTGVNSFLAAHPGLIKAFTVAASVIGTVTAAVIALGTAMKVASTAAALLSSTIPGLRTIMLVTAAVAGLAAGVTLLVDAFGGASHSIEDLDHEFDDLNAQINEQQNIIDLYDKYKKLNTELTDTSSLMDGLSAGGTGIDFKISADVKELLKPEDFVDSDTVKLSAKAAKKLSQLDFIPEGTTVKLSGEVQEALKVESFLDKTKVLISAEQEKELIAAGFLKDKTAEISGTPDPEKNLAAEDFLTETEVKLRPTPDETLQAESFLDKDNAKVTIGAEPEKSLIADDFLKDDTAEISGTPDPQKKLDGADFVGSKWVELSPKAIQYLAAKDMLTGTEVKLTPTVVKTLEAKGFLAGSEVTLTANITNLEDLQKSVESLTQKAAEAKEAWQTAAGDLGQMEERYGQLEARLRHAGTDADKNALKEEMTALTATIEAQKEKVNELETSYTSVSAELQFTTAAANSLQSKQTELLSVQEALKTASNGVITAMASEAEAYDTQAQKAREAAEAKKQELKARLMDNASKQASAYADAVARGAEAAQVLNRQLDLSATANTYMGQSADEINTAYQGLLVTLNEMQSAKGFNPLDADYQSTISQVENMAALFGETFDDLHQYADDGIDWVSTFGWLSTNAYSWQSAVEYMNGTITEYGDAVADANATQDTFISNLVSGIQTGTITMEEMEAIVKTVFPQTEEGAELAAYAIEQVKTAIEEAEASAEAAAESANTAGADMQAAMDPVLAKMTELADAYTAAYDAAYESMNGQFGLFEQAPTLTEESVDSMIANLQSQVAYMEQYAANLKEAATLGVSDGLLAQLSDGSKESAAYLAAIVSDGSTKIDELNASFAAVEQGKEDFASTVAEMQTDFSESMAALSAELESTVTAMNQSAEAAEAGRETIQAFADGAQEKLDAVRLAFGNVAAAAASALNVNVKIPGHAAGTTDAERGWALVGEQGPELMWFNGGEQVLNNRDTEAALRGRAEPLDALSNSSGGDDGGNTYNISVSPVYTISGTSDTAEIRDMLERNTEGMRSVIEEILDDINADRERSAYSL